VSASVMVSIQQLKECGFMALSRVGVPENHIEMTLDVLVTADLQGILTHGTRRLIPYIMRLRSNLINPDPRLALHHLAPSTCLVDGDNGLGPVVGMTGLNEALRIAKKMGVAFVGCRKSNHFGAGAPYALKACRHNMLCIGGTNAPANMVPWGGKDPILGNNPIFIGVPRRGKPHFILDIAMSTAARSKMRTAAERGERIPEGWALDPSGRPTTDPIQGLKGLVLPIGGHKGYGLALAVDILAGVLTGSGFGTGVPSLFRQWEKPQQTGHFFICLNPEFFMINEEFAERLELLLEEIKSSTPIDPEHPILVPGEIEAKNISQSESKGIPFDPDIWKALSGLSQGNYDIEVSKL